MKRILPLLLFILFPLVANDLETNLSSSDIEEMGDDLEFILKLKLTQRYYYPNEYRKKISEDITLEGRSFIYNLRTVKLSSVYGEDELTSYYTDVRIEGMITQLLKSNGGIYYVEIDGESTIFEEFYDYYGPKGTKGSQDYVRSFEFPFSFNRDSLDNLQEETSLYFLGTTKKFTRDDLKDLTLDELGYLRNEFFARKGFVFKTDKMKNYFSGKEWYEPLSRNVQVSEIETYNVYFIRGMEQELNFGSNQADVDQLNDLYEAAQRRLLTENDLGSLSPHKLPYLRNTFYARQGYIFYSLRYNDYFSAQEWYKGTSDSVDHLLSERDIQNIEFIHSHEVN